MNDKRVSPAELREVRLLEHLDDAQLGQISAFSSCRELAAGQRLFSMGDPVARFFYVQTGQIKLSRVSADGGEKVILVVRPGETFGEALMFMGSGSVYPVNADAIDASRLIAFDAGAFRQLLEGSVETCFSLMRSMSQRLHQLVAQIDDLTLHSATYRLASYLLEQLPEPAVLSRDIQLMTAKSVIASQLAIQPETFSRLLHRLQRDGLIEVHRDHIVIRDVEGLRKLLRR